MVAKSASVSAKPTRKQTAYDYIKEKILSCEYEPGSFMNEQLICDEMELSRTPVRDALSRLEQEGLVSIMPKKGFLVSELKLNDINHIYEVRLLVEPYVLRRYGAKLDQDQLRQFRDVISGTERDEHSFDSFYDLDDDFHGFIMGALSNRYLVETYENITNLNRRLRVLSGSRVENRIADTNREHCAIIDACLQKDWEGAANAMIKHLEAGRVAAFYLIMDSDIAPV